MFLGEKYGDSFYGFKDLGYCSSKRSGRTTETHQLNQEAELVRHSQVGGVTDGTFWVGSNTAAKLEGELGPNFRCLKDILSPMVGGLEIQAPPPKFVHQPKGEPVVNLHNGVLGHTLLLPCGSVKSQVYSLDVVARSAWSFRQPTSEEYATAYDLPVWLQKFGWEKTEGSLLFLSATPSKILMSFR
jgi:hypothetical protein